MPLYLAHRLFRGDATDAAFVARCLGGQPADLVFTDPPYNVSYGAHGGAEASRAAARLELVAAPECDTEAARPPERTAIAPSDRPPYRSTGRVSAHHGNIVWLAPPLAFLVGRALTSPGPLRNRRSQRGSGGPPREARVDVRIKTLELEAEENHD